VIFHLEAGDDGEQWAILRGLATISPEPSTAWLDRIAPEYTAKYGEWMQRLGITTESMAERYTALIEFTPLKAILQVRARAGSRRPSPKPAFSRESTDYGVSNSVVSRGLGGFGTGDGAREVSGPRRGARASARGRSRHPSARRRRNPRSVRS
jgi:hypothetical protein